MADSSVPKFEDTQEVSVPSFDDTHAIPTGAASETEVPGIPETLLHQGAQGLTMGFSDELTGAGGAAKQAVTGPRDWEAIKKSYVEMRDAERKKLDEQSTAHPIISTSANIAGAIPGAFLAGPSLGAAAGLGALTGLGTTPDITNIPQSVKDVAIGGALGAGANKLGEVAINPLARKMGQAGQSLLGKSGQSLVKNESEALANQVVNSIKSEKGKVGKIYEQILDANKDKKIDLAEFAHNLKAHADSLDTSLPEQARDKKAIMDLVLKVTEGPEANKIVGFQASGPVKTKDVVTGFRGTQSVPEGPSAADTLGDEGKRLIEQQRQLGNTATHNIVPSEDNSMLTGVLKTDSPEAAVSAKTIPNVPGSAARTEIAPIIEEQPFSTPIKPIEKTVREGGTLTPDVPTAKKLRSDLGVLAYEKNLSNLGEDLGQKTYKNLTDTLKDQIPGLAGADEKYTELLNASRKLGIKGNDEDVVRVLSKMTSSNQGKEIIVDQALESLDKVNPKLADTIRNTSNNLDQKVDMVDKISKIGDFNILNPKQLALGLIKNSSAIKSGGSNLLGQAERKLVNVPAGQLIQKTIVNAPKAAVVSPFSQEAIQGITKGEGLLGNNAHAANAPTIESATLYNATPESLNNVAQKLTQEPGLKFYGETLSNAIKTGDNYEKDRAIWLIMQNPKSRKLVTPEKKAEK